MPSARSVFVALGKTLHHPLYKKFSILMLIYYFNDLTEKETKNDMIEDEKARLLELLHE